MAEGGTCSISAGSDVIYDFFCEFCIDDGKHIEAKGYCVDCAEYLCDACFNGHTRTRSTRHHVLLGDDSMPKDTPLSPDRVNKDISTKCKVHGAKNVEFYCVTHRVLGCSTCFATVHKTCSNVESVLEKADYIFDDEYFKRFIEKLENMKVTLKEISNQSHDSKSSLKSICSGVVSAVQQAKADAVQVLNEIETNIVELAEQICLEDEERMTEVCDKYDTMSERVEKMQSEFDHLRSSKRTCQMYIKMRQQEGEVEELQFDIHQTKERNFIRVCTFEPNTTLNGYLRSQDAMGKFIIHNQQLTEPKALSADNIKATHVADICVRSDSDTSDNGITGIATLSRHRIIVVDQYQSKVKLVDTQTCQVINEITLSNWPRDVAVLSAQQVAVTIPMNNTIAMIRISNDVLEVFKESPVGGTCYGIAYSNRKLLLTFIDKPRLAIHDQQTRKVRDVQFDHETHSLFSKPHYVCVSNDDQTIYVSDFANGSVTRVSFDGNVKSAHKKVNLTNAQKLCTDHYGNIYVCCSGNIVQMISADGKIKTIIGPEDGLTGDVHSVSHCRDTNRLYVGMRARGIVKVYQLMAKDTAKPKHYDSANN